MLSAIQIKKFKSIEKINLELDRINILIGGNNSGKTSILQAIQFGVSIVQTVNISIDIKWNGEENKRSIEPAELVYSPLKEVSALAKGGELKQGEKYDIDIMYQDDKQEEVSVTVKRGKNRNILTIIKGKSLGTLLESMETPFCMFVPGLAGIPYFEEFKTESIVRKAAARGDANSVLRNILWLLKMDTEKWDNFIGELHQIFSTIEVDVSFNPKTEEHISAKIVEKKTVIGYDGNSEYVERELPIDAAGTGVLQAIQILSYINVYNPQILILDEPDAHLHPDNQRKIIRMIMKLAEKKNFQLILSTHSRHIIDEVGDKAKIFWIKDGGYIEEDEFDMVRILLELGALDKGDLLKQGKIKCVVLTEDSTDIDMMKILLEASGFDINEIDIWSYNGCTKIDSAILLSAFINKHAPSTKILIHRDRDYLREDEVEDYCKKIEVGGKNCFVTKGTDIESYYINAEHINYIYNSLGIERCKEIINSSIDEKYEAIIEKFINSRTMLELQAARKTGEGKINNGKICTECINLYHTDVGRYKHGKLVLKALKNNLQKEIGGNINLIQLSEFIFDEGLRQVAREIWTCE